MNDAVRMHSPGEFINDSTWQMPLASVRDVDVPQRLMVGFDRTCSKQCYSMHAAATSRRIRDDYSKAVWTTGSRTQLLPSWPPCITPPAVSYERNSEFSQCSDTTAMMHIAVVCGCSFHVASSTRGCSIPLSAENSIRVLSSIFFNFNAAVRFPTASSMILTCHIS
jgi:hypothetical protein